MSTRQTLRTTCNRDCPDACSMRVDVQDGRAVALRGDKHHPVTQGFLCHRTQRFLERQYGAERITRPLWRQGDRQVEIAWSEALDRAAEWLLKVRSESGPAAIFHYRSGGSLGLLKELGDLFFSEFGPVTVKSGDICSGAGDHAQQTDFGDEDGHDIHDIRHARHILNWGKNVMVSSVHWIPLLKAARARGCDVTLVDPVRTRSATLADRY
ncbi:MAG TPA: molybdopterin-dependent oxidoreductase, partial [Candidatus Xenobia bacterium]